MKPLSYITILFVLISCGRVKKSDYLDKERTVEEVHQMLLDYLVDINKEGLVAEFRYLDDSSDFFWVPPGYRSALSYDSVKTILERNHKAIHSIKMQWDTLQIFPLTNEIANYSGIVDGVMIDTAGIKSTMSIIESGTIIKREDGWKLLSGQSEILRAASEN
ncbi:MAG: hypothetical protein WBG90_03260 [Saonia sp.]